MTLSEVVKTGARRVRRALWAEPGCYLRLPMRFPDGRVGPWAHLFSRQTQGVIGEPTPQALAWWLVDVPAEAGRDWDVFTGARDPDDTDAE